MTKMLIDRATVEQALEALYEETAWFGPTPKGAAAITALKAALENEFNPDWDRTEALQENLREHMAAIQRLRAALAETQEPVEPVAYIHRQGRHWEVSERPLADDEKARGWTEEPLFTAPPQRPAEPVQEALTIERLRDALVASRIVPPAAVEDPDEYDDGVTLYRIEALHRRLA